MVSKRGFGIEREKSLYAKGWEAENRDNSVTS